jgi:2'-5' RNA ligase
MSVIRAFIAIDLTPEILNRLDKVAGQLKDRLANVPIRWVLAGNIHLTLKFLGDVSLANLELLKKILQAEAARHHGFEISVGGLGAFPSTRRPRVIWAGVEAPQELSAVHSGIETEMARLGYAREEREFSAHLTLGRVSRNTTSAEVRLIGSVLESAKIGFLGAASVNEVHLYKSDLQPDGVVYTRVFTAPLGEG